MSDVLNAADTPPDLNVNLVCDLIENYTPEKEVNADSSSNGPLIGGVGVLLLAMLSIVILVLKRAKGEDDDWFEDPEEMDDEMTPFYEEPATTEPTSLPRPPASPKHVDSWEELPEGEWLENDDDGTHWYRAHDGTHWHSTDDGYQIWDDS